MRARREASAAHVGNNLAAAYMLTDANDDLHRMAVARHDAIAMVNVDHVAIAAGIPAGRNDRTIGRGDDWRTHVVGNINARMEV